ncbi:hypothetical protein FG877_10515 [Enterococcus casseliflavus]|nr:hypothetical protein [Enterococcus casseliflavus]
MNTLAHKLLVDKSVKRKVEILQLILNSPIPISFKTLSEVCKVSYKTIQQDVNLLLENLSDSLLIVDYNHTLSIVRSGSNRKIIAYIDELIASNPLYHFIESSFYGEKKDLLTLALELYISESTIKKYVKILKKVLEEFKLTLEPNSFVIKGEEINVRYFYFQYFRYIHESSAPNISEKNYQIISLALHALKERYGLNLNFDYYKTILWMFIIETRTSQSYYVSFPEKTLEKFEKKESYSKYKMVMDDLFYLNIKHPITKNHELLFTYFSQLDTIIYESNRTYLTNDFSDEYNLQESMVTEFFLRSNRNIALNHKAKTALQSYLVNIALLTECSPLFQKYPEILCEKAKNKYPESYDIWYQILSERTDFIYIDEVAARMALLYEVKKYNEIKVLFALTGDSSSVSYFKILAEKILPNQAEAFFLFNRPLSNDLLLDLQIDCCVYNFEPHSSIVAAKTYRLSDIPLDIEWQELQDYLENFSFIS